jgi:hypothetical protein
MVVVFKRELSEYNEAAYRLFGLESDERYRVTNLDTGDQRVLRGRDLLEKGLDVRLLQAPDSAIFIYRRES